MSKIVALISPTNQTTKDSHKPDGSWDGARDGKVNGMGLCIGKDEIKGMWEGLVLGEGDGSWGMGAALSYPMVRVTVTTFMGVHNPTPDNILKASSKTLDCNDKGKVKHGLGDNI